MSPPDTKHTPGPWTVSLDGRTIFAAGHLESVAGTHNHKMPGKANAKLIAAAPEMANLLKEWQCFVLHGTSRRYSEREMLEWTAAVLAKVGL